MTTLVVPIDLGPLAVHSTWMVICATACWVCWFLSRVKADRRWTLDLQKKQQAAWQAPWFAMGEPVVVSRVDAESTIYKRRMWREDGFSWQEAA
jgi:hypothetical protein